MAPQLKSADLVEAELAIRRLNADFCFFLDHRDTAQLVELFAVDAHYSHGSRVSTGQAEIRALFERRHTTGQRISRHLQTGLRIVFENDNRARGYSVCMTFADDQPQPIEHTNIHLVADFIDQYLRGNDGTWRFGRRHIERIFVAPENNGPVGVG